MTYKWTDLSKTQQNQARRISETLWDEGIKATVSQIAKYFDEAMEFTRGQYDRAEFIALVGGKARVQ